jgi:hypothetical protein
MQTHASFNHALIILQKNFDSGAHDDNGIDRKNFGNFGDFGNLGNLLQFPA